MEDITEGKLKASGFEIEYCIETDTFVKYDGSKEILCSIKRPLSAEKNGVKFGLTVCPHPVKSGEFYIDFLEIGENVFCSIEEADSFIHNTPSPSPLQ